jgi:hypothetical protein
MSNVTYLSYKVYLVTVPQWINIKFIFQNFVYLWRFSALLVFVLLYLLLIIVLSNFLVLAFCQIIWLDHSLLSHSFFYFFCQGLFYCWQHWTRYPGHCLIFFICYKIVVNRKELFIIVNIIHVLIFLKVAHIILFIIIVKTWTLLLLIFK